MYGLMLYIIVYTFVLNAQLIIFCKIYFNNISVCDV